MNTIGEGSQFSLIKSIAMLSLIFFAVYSIKTTLSDCTIFSRANCDYINKETKKLEEEINLLIDEISDAKTQINNITCKEIQTSSQKISPKIDTTLWEEGKIEVLTGCWELDWDYKMRMEKTNEIVRVSSWDVCFKPGKEVGLQSLKFEDGNECHAKPIEGKFKGIEGKSILLLDDTKDIQCDEVVVFHRRLECELVQNENYAVCSSRTLQRDGTWIAPRPKDVRLSRKN
jgi:hypothetical protein